MNKITTLIMALCMLLILVLPTACSDWNDPEVVDLNTKSPKEQNPELWARYMEILRKYKQSNHYLLYARFENAKENPVNEGGFLRSLPDSLDIVSLSHSDMMTAYDREDIPLLQEKSTRVLYLVDYATQASTLTDITKLGAYLDKAIASATELNLDGFAFTGIPLYGGTEAERAAQKEKSQLIVSKLSAAAGQNKLLVFEGDPAFVETSDVGKLSYVVLNTVNADNITDIKLQVASLLGNGTLSKDKLLLATQVGNELIDEENVAQNAVIELTDRVASFGPLAGLALYDIGNDYYHTTMNYETTRAAIQLMNPSK